MKTISVITPTFALFNTWISDNQKKYPKAKYVKISRIDDIRGKEFDIVVKGYDPYSVNSEVIDRAFIQLKKEKS